MYVGHWCAFAKPGAYTVLCKRTLNEHHRAPKVAVTTTFKLKIVPYDPSPRNSYNMFLILAIEHCPGGPKYYYKFHSDPNSDGTAEQIRGNREILAAMKKWLAEHP